MKKNYVSSCTNELINQVKTAEIAKKGDAAWHLPRCESEDSSESANEKIKWKIIKMCSGYGSASEGWEMKNRIAAGLVRSLLKHFHHGVERSLYK